MVVDDDWQIGPGKLSAVRTVLWSL